MNQDAERIFDPDRVSRRLENRQRGPLELLKEVGVEADGLLDIGGGIGAIPLELFEAGLESATVGGASSAAAEAARSAAMARGLSGHMVIRPVDTVDLAPGLPGADIVNFERVICCYRI